MLDQHLILYAGTNKVPAVLNVVKIDTGRVLVARFGDYTVPTGATAKLYIVPPSGTVHEIAGTVDGNVLRFALTAESLSEYGTARGQVEITGGGDVSSLPFVIRIEEEATG